MKLYPFQMEAVNFHLQAKYSINASEMGTGKSIVALELLKRVGGKCLVLGPAFLEDNWHFEAKRFGVSIQYVRYSDLKTLRVLSEDPKKIGMLTAVVADEVHYLKNPQAKRTYYFDMLLRRLKPEYFLGLTGTPIKNRIPDLYSLLRFCSMCPTETNGMQLETKGPMTLAKWHKFANMFCYKQEFTVNGIRVPKYTGVKPNMVPVLKKILNGKLHRVTTEEVLPEMPPITRVPVLMKLKKVDGLKEAFMEYLENGKATSRAKAQSALLKAPSTIEYVESILEQSGGPVLVFTDHISSADMVGVRFSAPVIQGKTTTKNRTKIVKEFQDGQHPVLVATIGALSVGVTLHKANHVVFNDQSWKPSDNLQAEKRVHRIGQKRPCFIHIIQSSETDQYITKSLEEKLTAIRKVIDG